MPLWGLLATRLDVGRALLAQPRRKGAGGRHTALFATRRIGRRWLFVVGVLGVAVVLAMSLVGFLRAL